jgi:hypothetical protein
MIGSRVLRAALVAALVFVALAALRPKAMVAMPNFAQAYGVDCSKCHTTVPLLNSYGRYIQRSQYAFLDEPILKKALPGWIDYQAQYDAQADPPDTHKVIWGNLAIHADGVIGADSDISYHIQQWLYEDNGGGGLDTAWVSYNDLFKHNGSLEIGKLEVPAPSPYSQMFEIAPYALPEITVGEHTYELDANRWGEKLGYMNGSLSASVAYLGSDQDLNGATDFIPIAGRTLQYQAAFMRPNNPLEAGIYGAQGTYPISDGVSDRFSAEAAYVQRDPTRGLPGIFAVYQTTKDAYPYAGATGPATSHGYTLDLYEPIVKDTVTIGVRRELMSDGLGNLTSVGNIDLTVRLAKYLRLYTEAGLAGTNVGNGVNRVGTPDWRAFLWWTMPVEKVRQ